MPFVFQTVRRAPPKDGGIVAQAAAQAAKEGKIDAARAAGVINTDRAFHQQRAQEARNEPRQNAYVPQPGVRMPEGPPVSSQAGHTQQTQTAQRQENAFAGASLCQQCPGTCPGCGAAGERANTLIELENQLPYVGGSPPRAEMVEEINARLAELRAPTQVPVIDTDSLSVALEQMSRRRRRDAEMMEAKVESAATARGEERGETPKAGETAHVAEGGRAAQEVAPTTPAIGERHLPQERREGEREARVQMETAASDELMALFNIAKSPANTQTPKAGVGVPTPIGRLAWSALRRAQNPQAHATAIHAPKTLKKEGAAVPAGAARILPAAHASKTGSAPKTAVKKATVEPAPKKTGGSVGIPVAPKKVLGQKSTPKAGELRRVAKATSEGPSLKGGNPTAQPQDERRRRARGLDAAQSGPESAQKPKAAHPPRQTPAHARGQPVQAPGAPGDGQPARRKRRKPAPTRRVEDRPLIDGERGRSEARRRRRRAMEGLGR